MTEAEFDAIDARPHVDRDGAVRLLSETQRKSRRVARLIPTAERRRLYSLAVLHRAAFVPEVRQKLEDDLLLSKVDRALKNGARWFLVRKGRMSAQVSLEEIRRAAQGLRKVDAGRLTRPNTFEYRFLCAVRDACQPVTLTESADLARRAVDAAHDALLKVPGVAFADVREDARAALWLCAPVDRLPDGYNPSATTLQLRDAAVDNPDLYAVLADALEEDGVSGRTCAALRRFPPLPGLPLLAEIWAAWAKHNPDKVR